MWKKPVLLLILFLLRDGLIYYTDAKDGRLTLGFFKDTTKITIFAAWPETLMRASADAEHAELAAWRQRWDDSGRGRLVCSLYS